MTFYFTIIGILAIVVFAKTNIVIGICSFLTGCSFPFMLSSYKKAKKKQMYRNSNIHQIDMMSGTEFEKLLQAHFEKNGYKAKHTGKTGDYGADLLLYKDNEKIVIQAKRYTGKIGIKAVQEVISAREYYKANKAYVVTNSFFTNPAVNLAGSCNVELWDRNTLVKEFSIKK